MAPPRRPGCIDYLVDIFNMRVMRIVSGRSPPAAQNTKTKFRMSVARIKKPRIDSGRRAPTQNWVEMSSFCGAARRGAARRGATTIDSSLFFFLAVSFLLILFLFFLQNVSCGLRPRGREFLGLDFSFLRCVSGVYLLRFMIRFIVADIIFWPGVEIRAVLWPRIETARSHLQYLTALKKVKNLRLRL